MKKLEIPFSRLDKTIYKILLFLYFVLNSLYIAIQILLAFTKILGVEPSWINFVYLKAKYGSLYWLMPLGGIIMILIISSINLLDYRYEFLPLKYGYKYSLKISENMVKQIRTDRIACGILNIFFFMLLLLMVVKLFGTVINPSFDVPNQVISLLASAYFLITVLITIVYHIKSSNLAKLDRQQKKSLDRDNHEVL